VRALPRSWDELYGRVLSGEMGFHYGAVLAESGDAADVLDEVVHSRDPERGYGGANAIGYANAEVDALIEASAGTLHPLRRRQLLQECMRKVMADLAFIPLFVPHELYGVSAELEFAPRLDGVVLASQMSRRPAGRRR
jgi:peptide/nickel transport system substrate-binding protein